MITIREDGLVLIHRATFKAISKDEKMSDGDIIAKIRPDAYKDIEDARMIVDFINMLLSIPGCRNEKIC